MAAQFAALPISSLGRVSSPYGMRDRPSGPDLHTGVDIAAPEGTPVYAVLPGRVRVAAPSGQLAGYGNVLVIQHETALFSLYAHLRSIAVGEGAYVDAGQEIGTVGRTAGSKEEPGKVFSESGAHLHLEVLDRWPPRGRDLDRLNPADVLGRFGVLVPSSGPLRYNQEMSQPLPPAHAAQKLSRADAARAYDLARAAETMRAANGSMVPDAALTQAAQRVGLPVTVFTSGKPPSALQQTLLVAAGLGVLGFFLYRTHSERSAQ